MLGTEQGNCICKSPVRLCAKKKKRQETGGGSREWCSVMAHRTLHSELYIQTKKPRGKVEQRFWEMWSVEFTGPFLPTSEQSYWSLFLKLYLSYYFVGCCWINDRKFNATIISVKFWFLLILYYQVIVINFSFCLFSSVRVYGTMLLEFGREHSKSPVLNIHPRQTT